MTDPLDKQLVEVALSGRRPPQGRHRRGQARGRSRAACMGDDDSLDDDLLAEEDGEGAVAALGDEEADLGVEVVEEDRRREARLPGEAPGQRWMRSARGAHAGGAEPFRRT